MAKRDKYKIAVCSSSLVAASQVPRESFLTLDAPLQGRALMSGVQTTKVRPAKNKHTEYDMNITGHCQVNIIFHLGTHCLEGTECLSDDEDTRSTRVSRSGR